MNVLLAVGTGELSIPTGYIIIPFLLTLNTTRGLLRLQLVKYETTV